MTSQPPRPPAALPAWGVDNTSLWTRRYGRPPILPPGTSYASRPPRPVWQRLAIGALAAAAACAGIWLDVVLLALLAARVMESVTAPFAP